MKLADIVFTSSNARTVKEDSMHIDSLAESIEKKGLIAPIVLSPSTEEEGKYQIIAGQRRYLAFKKLRGSSASLAQGEYIIRNDGPMDSNGDIDTLELSIVENQFRESLSPMDLNRAALKLNQKGGYKDKDIAKLLNITPHRLKRIERLSADMNNMTPEIIEELKKSGDDAKFNDAHWDKMREIDDPATMKDVFDHIMEKDIPPRELPSLIKSVQRANDAAYGEDYDDEGGKGKEYSGIIPEEDSADGPLKYKHKGELTMDIMDNGDKVFRVKGRGEDDSMPIDQYIEYLSHPEKFKCKIDLKLTFLPQEDSRY